MKKFFIFLLIMSSFLVGCNKNDDISSIDSNLTKITNSIVSDSAKSTMFKSPESDWNSLTQTQKDDKIINRAYADLGGYGGQCKVWVKNVVYSASGTWVSVPATQPSPNDYLWYPIRNIVKRNLTIRNVDRGDMIQMKFLGSGGPHTAIIVSRNSTGIVWINSNFTPAFQGIVSVDNISFTYFDSKFGNQYSVYRAY